MTLASALPLSSGSRMWRSRCCYAARAAALVLGLLSPSSPSVGQVVSCAAPPTCPVPATTPTPRLIMTCDQLRSLVPTPGQRVSVRATDCTLDNPITINQPNVIIEGDPSVILRPTSSEQDAFHITASNVAVRDFKLMRSGSYRFNEGVQVSASNVTIHNVVVESASKEAGIVLQSSGTNL